MKEESGSFAASSVQPEKRDSERARGERGERVAREVWKRRDPGVQSLNAASRELLLNEAQGQAGEAASIDSQVELGATFKPKQLEQKKFEMLASIARGHAVPKQPGGICGGLKINRIFLQIFLPFMQRDD
uniref:Uncharacterized protein n=1 Tax=Macrostomum lignano TaxID=282301 RepID=A0A1I8FK33_9PLAT